MNVHDAMDEKDYYHIMQVDATADITVIAAAYKALAAKYHPDRNRSLDATRRMQEINEAYDILSDPQQRATYDRRRGAIYNGHNVNGVAPVMTMADLRAKDKVERAAQRIREIQERSLQQIRLIQERSQEQVKSIQDRASQQVKDVQDRAAQQIREIQQRTDDQIRGIQEAM
jgi:DnaJ-class molecular chaperone